MTESSMYILTDKTGIIAMVEQKDVMTAIRSCFSEEITVLKISGILEEMLLGIDKAEVRMKYKRKFQWVI